MESQATRAILILADISGYTRFMVANRMCLVHSQVIITELLDSIIRQVEIPLEIAKIEGDAVFLYAIKDDGQAEWQQVRRRIGDKLLTFFEAFAEKLAELSQSNICKCQACMNIEVLRLKLIVHSGLVLFHQVGSFRELAGVDVILAHRLLKNSVRADEYLLMTEAAYGDLAFSRPLDVVAGREDCNEIGIVPTRLYHPHGRSVLSDGRYATIGSKVRGEWRKIRATLGILLHLVRPRAFHHLPVSGRS